MVMWEMGMEGIIGKRGRKEDDGKSQRKFIEKLFCEVRCKT